LSAIAQQLVDQLLRPHRVDRGTDRLRLSAYPNIKRWLENMKNLKSWNQVNEVFSGFVAANKGKEFVRT
jgi:hypothetical protein